MIAVHFTSTGFVAKINHITSVAKNPRAVLLAGGRKAGNLIKKNFRQKDRTEPNKLGGTRQHFWRAMAASVSAPVMESPLSVSVAITDPRFRQKLLGGVITAKRAKALTIPVQKEAYGRSASVFEKETGLKLFLLKVNAHAFLAARLGDSVQIEYLLTPSVKQNPDPTALPDQHELETGVIETMQATLDRQLAGPGAAATPGENPA